jgi:hypothetical protein
VTDLYLILHKVRGEPAFDIASKLQIGDEEGWIIPTSGHRAYPRANWPIDLALEDAAIFMLNCTEQVDWDTWPDHYPARSTDDRPTFTLESLGLAKSKPLQLTQSTSGLKRL